MTVEVRHGRPAGMLPLEARLRERIETLVNERHILKDKCERQSLRIMRLRGDQREMAARIRKLEMQLAQALAGRQVRGL